MWHVLYLRVLVVLALLEGHVPNMELATLILQHCMSNVRRMPSHRGRLPMKPCVSAQSAQAAEAKMLGRLVNAPRSICKRSDVRAARETPTCGNGGEARGASFVRRGRCLPQRTPRGLSVCHAGHLLPGATPRGAATGQETTTQVESPLWHAPLQPRYAQGLEDTKAQPLSPGS